MSCAFVTGTELIRITQQGSEIWHSKILQTMEFVANKIRLFLFIYRGVALLGHGLFLSRLCCWL